MSGARKFVAWAVRRRALLWVVAILLAVPSTARTVWLYAHLHSELEELLPETSPSVVALRTLKARIGMHRYLGVVVDAESPDRLPAAEQFLDRLAERARNYPPGVLSAVRTGNDVEATFLRKHAGLYIDLDDLRTIRRRIEARRDYEVARATGALLDDTPPPPLGVQDILDRYRAGGLSGKTESSARYVNAERHLTVLLLELGDAESGAAAAGEVVDRVQADVRELAQRDSDVEGMRIGYAGDAAIATEELRALLSDLSWSSVVVVIAITLAIVRYYRWWRSVLVLLPPLLLATVYSFGVASLPPFRVTAVNSNTAFLASIIVGNGINFGLVLLSRYVEERRAGVDVNESLARAIVGSRAGTIAAAAAAAASYGALAVTKFQGFRQFGFIGGIGMLLAWGASFLLMPSLITWLDTGEATRPRAVEARHRFSYWVARGVKAAPRSIVVVSAILTVVAAVSVAKFRANDLESDFSRLRRRDTWTNGEGYWGERMNVVLGQYLTPLAYVADRPEDASRVAAELRSRMNEAPFAGKIASVRTIDDVLPQHQTEKLAELTSLRRSLTPAVRASLSADDRRYVDDATSDEALRPLTLADLPPSFLTGLRERDGTVGRVVLVYPNPGGEWWDASAIATFVGALRDVAVEATRGSGHAPPLLAGSIPLSSDVLGAIRHDGPLATGAALLGVVIVVLLMLRSAKMSAFVIGALVVGVTLMAGASHICGVRINFANFIAFPITFGIGVDYAVNVMSRYESEGSVDILGAVRSTGAAVALCSLTTIIGYSSLLMAENRALYLFGLIAVLGEVSCLAVALVSMPALVLVLDAPRRVRTSTADPVASGAGSPRDPHELSMH